MQAFAEGTFIPAAQRADMVYDSQRDVLYITNADSVLRYHLGTNSFLPPFQLSGSLKGIDLSPDGNTLAVADKTRNETNTWIHLINLQTGAISQALFPRAFGEGGTHTVAFAVDGSVLVTGTYEGSGWVPMRRYYPSNGALFNVGNVQQDTMLTTSADGSVVSFAESNISDGRWGRYRVADGNLVQRQGYTDGTSWFNYEIGVNRDATQYAIPTYGGTFIYDQNFVKTRTIGQYAGPQPIGVAFHPTKNLVYFAWAGTSEIRVFDTLTYAQVSAYNFEYAFTNTGNHAFTQGRLKLSRNGQILFATVGGGIRYVNIASPPIALPQSYELPEDYILGFGLSGTSSEGNFLTGEVLTNPANGTITTDQYGNLTYRPATNFNGLDTFTYRVRDGQLFADATVTINVTPVNDGPTANDQQVSATEDTATVISLTGNDVDGDALTYRIYTQPMHGTVSLSGSQITYTPASNYYGYDMFMFEAVDGITSGAGMVSINVSAVNDAPVANAQTVLVAEDGSVMITLSGSDVEGGGLSYVLATQPAHGTLSGYGQTYTYAPSPNYYGSDSFSFTISDGWATSASATVSLNVTPVNDAPVANGQTVSVVEDTPKPFALIGSDVEGNSLTYTVVSAPTRGALGGTAPNLTYTPAANYNGTDSFTFSVSDGAAISNLAIVTLQISAVNDAPVANAQTAATAEDTPKAITLTGIDIEGSALSFVVVNGPANGTLSGVAPNLIYSPTLNYNGPDSFMFMVNDGLVSSAVETVALNVTPVNDAPLALADVATTRKGKSVTISVLANDTDVEGNVLSASVLTQGANGTVTLVNSTQLRYMPGNNFTGTDTFTYRVSDGQGGFATGTVTVTVTK